MRNSTYTSNYVLFCLIYKHNTPLLIRKFDLINEWMKGSVIRAIRLKMNKMRGIITKTNSRHNFQFTEFLVIDFFRTDKGNLLGYRAKIGEKWFSSASRKILTSLFVSDTNYSVLLAAIAQENFDKWRQMENGEGSAIHSLTWEISAKGKWRVSSWLAISNSWKIIVTRVLWRLSSEMGILNCKTQQFM